MVVYKTGEQTYIMEDSYVLQLQEPKFREFYLSYSGYAQCGPLHMVRRPVRII